jgi:mono/diheme cytochrome c family protein
MNAVLIAMLLLPLAQGPANNPVEAGQALWQSNNACSNCHGSNGQGAFGPDLAGHQLSPAQFLRAVRKPWGVMPAFTPEKNFSDQEIANLAAYLASLPKVAAPGEWRTPIPPNASAKQQVLISNGCGQCHGAIMGNPRRDAGGEGADFEWFKSMVYTHTTAMGDQPRLRMGNYSRTRVPEVALRQIWEYMTVETGLRVPVNAQISAATPDDRGATFTLTVTNAGIPGKGLTAENLSIGLTLAPNTTVAATTGAGYQGVRNGNTAVWQLARLAPGEKQTYTITISGASATAGVTGGNIGWAKPAFADGSTDTLPIAAPRPAQRGN